ncbi:hypothetical protein ND861_18575 [Leptospira sp. 2 VSF19]|uniref:DUF2726 domain-containing protein n=1 Tax=Leptospira soteropolitanensis TaxID=2950025 RepID=A0AAW5VQ54_9LEPT|nr:hypothetical protein [Leptospira soteropolitanensis]MCW7494701.1 hypothetical protein [Leptospira soteropolitanensis]MCW7502252.1 hypothetical protein [Leptospira soteropolitanensis]MCW7524529.1 hypothetical protein [Leptospira soteropolitanensis]MCW7528369.1 hypothetical protein [Leptospira soteropolitanensis]MCW7532260.1 hypothetical protein [Leptospira soteropolitanensis]
MNAEQSEFYKRVEQSLIKGEYIDIAGNISYVFLFLYKLISRWNKLGFENLSEYLIYLSEIYAHENKLSEYCLLWAHDCLLGLKKYEIYLEKTEPKLPYGTATHISNLRLNIQKKIGLEANPIDILLMVGGRKSKFIVNNEALYKDKCREIFSKFPKDNENWFLLFDSWNIENKLYPHLLFSGAVIPKNPEMDFKIEAFYSAYGKLDQIKNLSKEAENLARKEMGVPLIGEGWISETELFRKLELEFPITKVIQHGQPDWLGRQHFDIWFPNWKIAVEYHGKQHFEPVEFFGGASNFDKTVERDLRKAEIARKNKVHLIIVKENYDLQLLITEIKNISNRRISAPS